MDLNEFRKKHMNVSSDQESSSEQEDQKPDPEKLRGFKFESIPNVSKNIDVTGEQLVPGEKAEGNLSSRNDNMADPKDIILEIDEDGNIC